MSAPKADEDTVRYEEKTRTSSPGSSPSGDEHADVHHATRKSSAAPSAAALLRNPLTGMTEEDVIADVDEFVESKGLAEYREVFRKGALLARVNGREEGFEDVSQLSEEEKSVLRHEVCITSAKFDLANMEMSDHAQVEPPLHALLPGRPVRWLRYRSGNGSNGRQWCPAVLLSGIQHRRRPGLDARSA